MADPRFAWLKLQVTSMGWCNWGWQGRWTLELIGICWDASGQHWGTWTNLLDSCSKREQGIRNKYRSWIDFTLLNQKAMPHIENWSFGNWSPFSDHCQIYFELNMQPQNTQPILNRKFRERRADWSLFRQICAQSWQDTAQDSTAESLAKLITNLI